MVNNFTGYFSSTPIKGNILGIGHDDELLYHDSTDMKLFVYDTMGKTVVIGGKTFDQIPNKLPGRRVLVLRNKKNRTKEELLELIRTVYSGSTPEEDELCHIDLNFNELFFLLTHPRFCADTWMFLGGATAFEKCQNFLTSIIVHEFSELPTKEPNVFINLDGFKHIATHTAMTGETEKFKVQRYVAVDENFIANIIYSNVKLSPIEFLWKMENVTLPKHRILFHKIYNALLDKEFSD